MRTRAFPLLARPSKILPLVGLIALPLAAQPANTEAPVVLDPFLVKATEQGAYTVEEAHTGTIIAVPRDQIPFVTSVLTGDMLRDLGIDNPADITQFVAGVSRNTNPLIADERGQTSLSFRVRGFASNPLYDGFQTGGRVFASDNLGRVEVSKGPNSVLYGQAPAGGVVNFIPQAPRFKDHASFSVAVGTNNFQKAVVNVGGPLQLSKLPGVAAFNIGGSIMNFEREQIFFDSETTSLFGGLSWRPTDHINFELRADYVHLATVPSRTPAFVSLGSGPNRVVDPFNRLRHDRNFTYNGPFSRNKLENYLTTFHTTVRLTDNLTFRAGAFLSEKDTSSLLLRNTFGLSVLETVRSAEYANSNTDDRTRALKGDLLWQVKLGHYTIDNLFGFEAHWENSKDQEQLTPANLVVSIPFTRTPVVSDFPKPPPLSAFTRTGADSARWLDWTNVRFTQFIKAPDDRFTVMWGIARGNGDTNVSDRFRSGRSFSDGSRTTYTAGATFAAYRGKGGVLDQAILFGNYSTSFNIQGGNQQNPADFQNFTSVAALRAFVNTVPPNAIAPQEGNGFEVGSRSRWFNSKLDVTLLYFEQTNENIARNFFVRESNVAGVFSENVISTFQLAGGREKAKGVELAMDWNPTANLTFTASAQITDGKVKENPEAPEEIGFGLVQSPEEMYSFWSRYSFPSSSALNGLTLGFGLSHNTPTRIRPESNDRFRLSDSYTNARALLSYRFKFKKSTQRLTLNVENVFDEEFTQEDNFLSEPRLWRFSYGIDF